MPTPSFNFQVRGSEEFSAFISGFPRHIRGLVTEAVAEWLIGNSSRGLKHYVNYKYVSRKAAYGRTFVSDKQRRYVMARIREGTITPGTPNRTFRMQRGWSVKNSGVKSEITNSEAYTEHVMGTGTQSRHEAKVGWREVAAVVSTNIAGAMRHANAAIREYIESRG